MTRRRHGWNMHRRPNNALPTAPTFHQNLTQNVDLIPAGHLKDRRPGAWYARMAGAAQPIEITAMASAGGWHQRALSPGFQREEVAWSRKLEARLELASRSSILEVACERCLAGLGDTRGEALGAGCSLGVARGRAAR